MTNHQEDIMATLDEISRTEAQISAHIKAGDIERAFEEAEMLKDLREDLTELKEVA